MSRAEELLEADEAFDRNLSTSVKFRGLKTLVNELWDKVRRAEKEIKSAGRIKSNEYARLIDIFRELDVLSSSLTLSAPTV